MIDTAYELTSVTWQCGEQWDGEEWADIFNFSHGLLIVGHSASQWGAAFVADDYVGMCDFSREYPEYPPCAIEDKNPEPNRRGDVTLFLVYEFIEIARKTQEL